MDYPLIISFEMSSYENDAFPVAVAWTLPEGSIKSSLIQPDDEWLENSSDTYLDIDSDRLLQDGHGAKAILEELQNDRGQEALYSPDPDTALQALDQLYVAVEGVNDLPLRPLAELFSDVARDEIDICLQESQTLLELEPHSAEGQVRLWLEAYTRLC